MGQSHWPRSRCDTRLFGASSVTQHSKANALGGIASVRKNAAIHARFDRRTSTAGDPYFVLKARNGEPIGRSEMYSSTSACENGIRSVETNAPAVRNVGAATALGGFIVLVALRLGIGFVAGKPDTEGGRAAANSILAIGTELLRRSAWSEILIGLLIVLGASLTGPARYAKRARHYTAQGFRRSAVATWIGFAVLVLVVLTWSPFSAGGNWVTVLIVLILIVFGVEAIRRTSLAEEAAHIENEAPDRQGSLEPPVATVSAESTSMRQLPVATSPGRLVDRERGRTSYRPFSTPA